MNNKSIIIAKLISTIFNPFLLIGPIQIIYFIGLNEITASNITLILIILFQAILPFTLILLFIKLHIVSDFEITDKDERTLYFSILTTLFIISAMISFNLDQIFIFNASLSVAVLSITIISLFWKISGHLMLDTILFLGLISISSYFIAGLPILILVAWSRIILKKHSLLQTIVGSILGTAIFSLISIVV